MPPTEDKRKRGAYRVGLSPTSARNELLRDPQVAAFAEALAKIDDPMQRACIEWLVRELARDARNKRT
jgi:hypothetical protein